jgi:hypothetical protein
VDKVAWGEDFFYVLQFFPVYIIPLLHHIHSYIRWGWTKGPSEDQFHRDIVSPNHNNNKGADKLSNFSYQPC